MSSWRIYTGPLALSLTFSPPIFANDHLETVEVYGQRDAAQYGLSDGETATRLGLSVLETPQSLSAISRSQLDDFALHNLNDALANQATVQVQSIETDRTYYTARGFDITNFQRDGIGLPLSSGSVYGSVDSALFERIDVLRGANGLMSGAGNPSATINLIRKRPSDDLALSVAATLGPWNTRRLEVDAGGALAAGTRGRLVAAIEKGESHLDRYETYNRVIYGVIEQDLASAGRLTAGLTIEDRQADSPLWGALPMNYSDGSQTDYDVSTSTSADWAYWDNRNRSAFVEWSMPVAEDWQFKAVYQYDDTDSDSHLFYMYNLPDRASESGMIGYASEYTLDDRRQQIDAYLQGRYTLWGREHDAVFGVNYAQSNIEDVSLYDYTNGFPAIGDFSQWRGRAPTPNFVDGRTGSDWQDVQQAAYAASRIRLSEQLSFIGGVRVLDWRSKGDSYGKSKATRASGKVLPYSGVVYEYADNHSAYLSYTETFMPQRDLDRNDDRLDPAEGSNTELGLKSAFFDQRLTVALALFQAKHQHVAESDGFDTALGRNVYVGRDYQSEGLELDVYGQIAEGLSANVSLTQLRIEDEEGDTARRFVPKRIFAAALSYQLPWASKWKLGSSVRWQDDTRRDTKDGMRVEQKAYSVVNAFVSYQYDETLSIAINANNLGDEKYLNSLYWDQAFYAAPRNASLTVRWNY